MKKFLLLASVFVAVALLPKLATAQGLYGENCTNLSGTPSCGIGDDIVLTSIKCYVLNNNNPNDTTIPCQQTLAAYGTLPTTYDPTKLVWKLTTNTASYGEVRGGGFGVTDTIWSDSTVGTTHTVIVDHVAPGAGADEHGAFYDYYVASCQHSFPCNNADGTFSSYPGPTGTVQGAHAFRVIAPLPVSSIPSTWEMNEVGHMPAWQGSFATLPIFILQKTGRFSTLPGSGTLNNVITNGSNWFYWGGSSWVTATPEWYVTNLSITIGATTYNCHADSLGNHTLNTGTVENTCTNGSSDSGTALVVYYAGLFGTQSQDYRDYKYDSSVGQYYFDVSTADAPPTNPTIQISLEVYPGATAITGAATANATFTLYSGAPGHAAAVPATSYTLNLPVNIKPVQVLASDPPRSFTTDANLVSYEQHAAQSTINLCSSVGESDSLLGWLQGINTATWWSIGPAGYWNEHQSWLYDQGKVYTSAEESFMRTMSGGSWGDWLASSTFGNNYAHLIIKPTVNNLGNFFYMAMTSGATGSSEPNWNAHTQVGAEFTDNGVTWMTLGNQTYWEMCIVDATDPYAYAVVTNGARSTGQFSQYGGGSLKADFQTGDSFPQDGSYQAGTYSRAVKDLACANTGSSECSPDQAFTGLPAFQNVFSPNAGRGQSNFLESYAYNWRLEHFLGTDSNFTSDQTRIRYWQLTQNALINYIYYEINQSNVATTNSLDNFYLHADSFYFGIVMEALETAYDTDVLLDPTNSVHLLDARIPQAIKDMTDYMHSNWFDQPFSQQGIHSYSMGFTPHDLEVVQGLHGVGGTTNAFFNELEAFMVPAPSWLYAYCGNSCTGPGSQSYDSISDVWRIGAFSAYHGAPGALGFWYDIAFPDGQWLHNWQGATGSPKQQGMSYKEGLGNDEQWRNGFRAWSEMDVDPGRNPCRDGSNGPNPCVSGHHSAFADTMPAYPYQLFGSGSSRIGSYPYNQIDPTDCPVPCHFTGDKASPISNVASTSFTVTAFTPEQASMSISYGTTTACATGTATTEDAGFPQQLHLTTAEIWQHQFTLQSLLPSTNYHVKFNTIDQSGNAFSTNCGTTPGGWSGGNLNVTTLAQTLLIISSGNPPNGTINTAYSFQFTAAGGTSPYTWSQPAGTIPPGLTLTSAGLLSGIPSPTDSGNYTFTIQVTDNASPTHNTAQQTYTVNIASLVITTTSPLASGTQGLIYNQAISATGGVLPYTWTTKFAQLPAGVTVSQFGNNDIVGGVPTQSGLFTLSIQVQDSTAPTPQTASKAFFFTIAGGPLTITSLNLPQGNVGNLYSFQLAASGGTGTGFTWCVIENSTCDQGTGGALPVGLSMSSSGFITGTPANSGVSSFTVQVTDSGSNQATAPLTITIGNSQLAITTNSLAIGLQGRSYSQTLIASGGQTPYNWCVLESDGITCDTGTGGALPAGMSLTTNGSNQGVLAGTPTQNGVFNPTFQVMDSSTPQQTANVQIPLTIQPPLIITTTSVPSAVYGIPYGASVAASGGIDSYTWNITAGSLPTGLTGSTVDNQFQISGTPTVGGYYPFTLQVTDSDTDSTSANFEIDVLQITSPATLPAGTQGTFYSYQMLATGGTAPYGWSVPSGTLCVGITLSPSGVLSGIPGVVQTCSVVIMAADSSNPQRTVVQRETLTINSPSPIRPTGLFGAGSLVGGSVK